MVKFIDCRLIVVSMITRYLFKSSLIATLAVIAVLMVLQGFMIFLGELKDMGVGDYHAWQALQYVLFCAPYELQKCLPMALLLGHLLGLGALARHHEILILFVSGMSRLAILRKAFLGALLMVLCISMVTEIIVPKGRHLAKRLKAVATTQGQTLHTHYGTWVRYHNYFIHIDNIVAAKQLQGITWYEFDNQHRIKRAAYAENAHYQHDHWQLSELRETIFSDDVIHINEQASSAWVVNLNPKFLMADSVDPGEMSLTMLSRYLRYLKDNHRHLENYGFVFWKRVLQPLAMALMVFISIPFVFGMQRNLNVGVRILYGSLFGFGFYLLNEFLGPFSLVYQVPPWLAAVCPILLFSVIALSCVIRMR